MIPSLSRATAHYIRKIMVPQKEKISFSKMMVITIFMLTLAVTIFTFIMCAITADTTPLIYLIPAVFTECSVVSGFYSYKAKSENEIKLNVQKRLIQSYLDDDLILEEEEGEDEYNELE